LLKDTGPARRGGQASRCRRRNASWASTARSCPPRNGAVAAGEAHDLSARRVCGGANGGSRQDGVSLRRRAVARVRSREHRDPRRAHPRAARAAARARPATDDVDDAAHDQAQEGSAPLVAQRVARGRLSAQARRERRWRRQARDRPRPIAARRPSCCSAMRTTCRGRRFFPARGSRRPAPKSRPRGTAPQPVGPRFLGHGHPGRMATHARLVSGYCQAAQVASSLAERMFSRSARARGSSWPGEERQEP
jgi:hypothetical protein